MTAAAGMSVRVAFSLTKEDGTVVDSRDSGNPLEFVCGEGLVFPGLDRGVQGMAVGETRTLHLQGQDVFGAREQGKELELPAAQLPPECRVGVQLKVTGPVGEDIWATVIRRDGDKATLDLNHPLAGVALTMSVTLLGCEAAPELPPFEVETTSPGDGRTYPGQGDRLTIHYAGAVANGGASFMSTRDQGEPFAFTVGVGQVIRGLDEGIVLMSLGERATIRIPALMAYGDRGKDGIVPPNADLVYDVELLKIEPAT
mmetsp:Transcript_43839/g.121813  ORF Transcript_43839/g.121813 Transcript_43839/m.121813 type:complete len:257 (-) Transcript_43839:7-777(-)